MAKISHTASRTRVLGVFVFVFVFVLDSTMVSLVALTIRKINK